MIYRALPPLSQIRMVNLGIQWCGKCTWQRYPCCISSRPWARLPKLTLRPSRVKEVHNSRQLRLGFQSRYRLSNEYSTTGRHIFRMIRIKERRERLWKLLTTSAKQLLSKSFNPSKSAVMVFRGKRKDKLSRDECDILLGDSPVPYCAETKHLGVTITQSLSWTPHVDKLLQRVSYKVHILKRLAYRCNSGNEFVAHLYLTLVRPVLEYAGPVWDACSRTDSLRLERAQWAIFT